MVFFLCFWGCLLLLTENLRYARKQCGYTQQQVADFLGINRSSYTYYEAGHNALPLDLLPGLCKLFGVSADWLLHDDLSFHSEGNLLLSWEENKLPGLAKLTNEERALLLLLRKHDLTESVSEYVRTLVDKKESQ